jgi:hypothetical protein
MYSIAQRANSVFAFFVTVCLGIVVAVASTSPFILVNSQPPVEIVLKDVVMCVFEGGLEGNYWN